MCYHLRSLIHVPVDPLLALGLLLDGHNRRLLRLYVLTNSVDLVEVWLKPFLSFESSKVA